MIRLPIRTFLVGLRPSVAHLQQTSPVCSVCLALSQAQRQQQQQQQQQQEQGRTRQQQARAQPRRQLQMSTPLRYCIFPDFNPDYVRRRRDDFDIRLHWTYGGPFGADNWRYYFKACSGSFQSPVDLNSFSLVRDGKLDEFSFTNFDNVDGVTWLLENNGHSAQVTYVTGDLRVSGGGLLSEYGVEQFHFHWGGDDTRGSEHTINGVPFPMEMHVVTYNRNYGSLSNALSHSDGLAVLGVFFQVDSQDSRPYQNLVTALNQVKEPGSSYALTPVPLETLLPMNTKQYYRYPGSLTTPPCSEVITWTLFKDPMDISSQQLSAFRELLSLEEDETGALMPLVDNFRPIQLVNGRKIKSSF